MGISFSGLDRRLSRDIRELHDYLWRPSWVGDEDGLRERLMRDAKELDAILSAKGRLRRDAEALAKPWSRDHQGSALFELLDGVHGLTAAVELARQMKFHESAVRAQAVVESTSIGVCSAAGCFGFVEEWEARKVDFETYSGKLSGFLEPKLIPQAALFKRVLDATHAIAADWDGSASKAQQGIAARAAINNAAWCVLRSLTIRSLLGRPQKVPEKDFESFLASIVSRL